MDKTKSILEYFSSNISVLYKISHDEIIDIVALCTTVLNESDSAYDADTKKNALSVLCAMIQTEILPLKDRWVLFWSITFNIFTSTKYDYINDELIKAYRSICLYVESCMPKTLLAEETDDDEQDGNTVVIVTSQFLDFGHAPTRRVLDYACTIQEKLGYKVVIINDGGLNYDAVSYIKNITRFWHLAKYNEEREIKYNGKTFPFYQNPVQMPDIQAIANIVYNIKRLHPRLVLNVGDNCITSDLCRHFAKTATIRCSTGMPQSIADNLVLGRDLRKSDEGRIKKLESRQRVIESRFNYVMPPDNETEHYSRADFEIPEDAFVISSAGHRLHIEMDDDFISMVDDILEKLPDSYFMVIGYLENIYEIDAKFKYSERVRLTGKLKDGSQAVRLTDLYIQPRRKGGGRAAFEALYYGIPAIIPDYGDAWDVCGSEYEVSSYDEMEEKVLFYYNNRQEYGKMCSASRQRGLELEDMEGTFRKLFKDLDIPVNQGENMVDESSFYDIFAKKDKDVSDIKASIKSLLELTSFINQRLRTNEWATVFNSTIVGSEWLKDVPLSPGRVALDWPGVYSLYRVLDEIHPKSILEIGLGQSTKIIGSYAIWSGAKHYIVEHNESWIGFFTDKHKLADNTEVVCLPRREEMYNGKYIHTDTPIKFYDGFAERFKDCKFDLIFVDGPQGSDEYSRVDVTEILPEALNGSFVIMVDDSGRQGEKHTIKAIYEIITNSGIKCHVSIYDGMKDTAIIVSDDLQFLMSL